jgi:hypothetical protein
MELTPGRASLAIIAVSVSLNLCHDTDGCELLAVARAMPNAPADRLPHTAKVLYVVSRSEDIDLK